MQWTKTSAIGHCSTMALKVFALPPIPEGLELIKIQDIGFWFPSMLYDVFP